MSFAVEVGLLSGRTVSLETGPDEYVETLRSKAQKALAVGRGKLVDASNTVLDGAATLQECRLQQGDTLTLQVSSIQVGVCENTRPLILTPK